MAADSARFRHSAQDLVLSPIEDMISKVKEITKNPIQAAQQAEEDAVRNEEQEKLNNKGSEN